MKFSPCFYQPSFSRRDVSADHFHRFHAEDGRVILVIRVEVGTAMRSPWLGEHSNDDAKEATDLGHISILRGSQL
jgi:hypothetical protein